MDKEFFIYDFELIKKIISDLISWGDGNIEVHDDLNENTSISPFVLYMYLSSHIATLNPGILEVCEFDPLYEKDYSRFLILTNLDYILCINQISNYIELKKDIPINILLEIPHLFKDITVFKNNWVSTNVDMQD